ncbi:MAG: hypothetical protein MHM6MM_000059 [Cercozoa sp. M6MM]
MSDKVHVGPEERPLHIQYDLINDADLQDARFPNTVKTEACHTYYTQFVECITRLSHYNLKCLKLLDMSEQKCGLGGNFERLEESRLERGHTRFFNNWFKPTEEEEEDDDDDDEDEDEDDE